MIYRSEQCLDFRYCRCFLLVMDLHSQAECFVCRSIPQCEFEYLSLELLIKLAYPATKYQCTPLRVEKLVVHRAPSQRSVTAESGGWGSSSTGQTVSERGRGSVTYCFTGKLPDLLGVKARSSLVYTQPWISAWNMSTSSQPISHRGGAVWAADTSRFPWTMRPIPHACLLSVTGGVERQTQTEALYCSTGPQNYLLPGDPHGGTSL